MLGDEWIADVYYYLKEKQTFQGNIISKIIFSPNSSRWEIINLRNDMVIAFCNETTDYPFGAREWYFLEHNCKEKGKMWKRLLFHQSVEEPGNE